MQRREGLVWGIMFASLIIATAFIGHRIWIYETSKGPSTLDPVEIREYQGQALSSINDFRENSIKGPQHIDRESYRLKVTSLRNDTVKLGYEEILAGYHHYEKVVTLFCVEGWYVNILWEGVLVRDLLEEVNIDPGVTVVIFRAVDGYTTSLPLDYVVGNDIIMAHKMNGVELPPERGFPFQLVAESKRGYKWIKWVTEIELSGDESYRGYWESRGYSNEADLP